MSASPAVFIGLGSNLGDREAALRQALVQLEQRRFQITARSSIYLTEPVGGPPQEWFLNAVVEGRTDLSPEALLAACQEVEQALGRVRVLHHGPRTLDLDLLLFGSEIRRTADLELPHPGLPSRRFVLVPLAEIAPQLRHPISGLTVEELCRVCPDHSRVELHPAVPSRP